MFNNPLCSTGATQTHARTRELFPPAAISMAAKTIARLQNAEHTSDLASTPFELEACGRRNRHCVGIYSSACRNRGVVIAEIRRPVTPGSSLPSVDGQEIGATVEIAERWGRWHLIQAKGASNGEPVASAVAAIHRLLVELNGEVI